MLKRLLIPVQLPLLVLGKLCQCMTCKLGRFGLVGQWLLWLWVVSALFLFKSGYWFPVAVLIAAFHCFSLFLGKPLLALATWQPPKRVAPHIVQIAVTGSSVPVREADILARLPPHLLALMGQQEADGSGGEAEP